MFLPDFGFEVYLFDSQEPKESNDVRFIALRCTGYSSGLIGL